MGVRHRADDPLRPTISDARARRRWGMLAPWVESGDDWQPDDGQIEDGADWIDEGQSDDISSDAGAARRFPDDDAAQWAVRPRSPRWQQAVDFGREHVAVVVVAMIVGLVFAVMTFLHSRTQQVPLAPDVVVASGPAATATGVTVSASPTPEPVVKVHVMGAVMHPGVVTLRAGARVEDAIQAAGGLTADADPAQLNLAAVVADGSQIVIGTVDDPRGDINGPGTSGGQAGAATSGSTSLVNINTASQAELETLPGVGPVTAQKILTWRAQHGKFTTIDELQEIDGIGPKTMANLEPYVCV